jgi:hypothetical protein
MLHARVLLACGRAFLLQQLCASGLGARDALIELQLGLADKGGGGNSASIYGGASDGASSSASGAS